jgi:predicted RNA binding protein YcfA (HicA-like mRNA interferase family)
MRPRKLLQRIHAKKANVRFSDFERLVVALGFRHVDTEGSHRTYEHRVHKQARLNLQPMGGEAKRYQIKQLLHLVEEYNLQLDEGNNGP